MILIVVDYDNDSVRIESDKGRVLATIKISAKMSEIEALLTKIFTHLSADGDGNVDLSKQDEGHVINIDYY